jgi:RNA polymerase sigma factor (sigma-70 family)
MSDPEPIELTAELLAIARKATIIEARKRCPKSVDPEDVWQSVCLDLVRWPPKYDPSRKASKATLLKLICSRAVSKFAAKAKLDASRFKQVEVPERESLSDIQPSESDDIFCVIDSEDTRRLCQLMMDCNCNMSEVARRMGISEGSVRSRLKLLAIRLKAAGFKPFREE